MTASFFFFPTGTCLREAEPSARAMGLGHPSPSSETSEFSEAEEVCVVQDSGPTGEAES